MGIELITDAVVQFFAESGIEYDVENVDGMDKYTVRANKKNIDVSLQMFICSLKISVCPSLTATSTT